VSPRLDGLSPRDFLPRAQITQASVRGARLQLIKLLYQNEKQEAAQ